MEKCNTVTDALSRLNIDGHHLSLYIIQDCFGPTQPEENLFPMNTAVIAEKQEQDKDIMTKLESELDKDDSHHSMDNINRIDVITKDGKIIIPKCLTSKIVNWYHHFLCHPGATCMEKTLRQTMT